MDDTPIQEIEGGFEESPTPYGEILPALTESIRRALYEFVTESASRPVTDIALNRHFAWLGRVYPQGLNQHLFDSGTTRNMPLRTEALRRSVPDEIAKYLDNGLSLPIGEEAD